jgi:hypothetical protein
MIVYQIFRIFSNAAKDFSAVFRVKKQTKKDASFQRLFYAFPAP